MNAKLAREQRSSMRDRERRRRVVRYELGKRLLELRGGDVEAMVDRLLSIVDGEVVALRDHGREALVYDDVRASIVDGRLDLYRVGRDGSAARIETGYWRGDLDEWLEEHRDELDWVHHE